MKRIVMIGSGRDTRGGISAVVNVYFASGLFERWDAEYLETHCDGSKALKAWKAARAWLGFMARLAFGEVALLHVHIASDASFWRKSLFIAPAHALRIPYVIHMHGGDFQRFHQERCGPIARRLLRLVYGHASAVVALSQAWKRIIEAAVPDARVVVVPNPVEIPRAPANVAAEPGTVVYLGVIKDAKGTFDLLEAWRIVAARHPDARLVIAGSGEIEKLHYKACEMDLEERIDTPGWIGGRDKAAVLQRGSLFVLPSHFEALPMALLEGMAAGLPVVATRVGGIPDVVADGREGLLVPPRDPKALAAAIDTLLATPSRRVAMSAAARKRIAERFSVEAVVPRIESLWAQYAAHAKRTSAPGPAFP